MDNQEILMQDLATEEDDGLGYSLRPEWLNEFIGQERAKEQLRIHIEAAKKRSEALEHVLLVSPPGLGKTTLARIIANEMESGFKQAIGPVMERLDLASTLTNLDKGDILFIDEIHTIIGAGGAEGAIDASSMLKPSLSRGQIQCVGATTMNEYKKYIERDAALERRFQSVLVEEPNIQDTVSILNGVKSCYEDYHNVSYTPGAVEMAAALANRYVTERFLPDKAIDIMDEAVARKRIPNSLSHNEIPELQEKVH